MHNVLTLFGFVLLILGEVSACPVRLVLQRTSERVYEDLVYQ